MKRSCPSITLGVFLALGAWNLAKAADYVLGAGDVIEIFVLQQPELNLVKTLTTAGEISYPYIDVVALAGKTEFQAQKLLARKLQASRYVKNPEVVIRILEHRSGVASVEGGVSKPGEYPVIGNLTVRQLLSRAGGVDDITNAKVTLFRKDQAPVRLNLLAEYKAETSQLDSVIQRGDRVLVEYAEEAYFYTYGAVKTPNRYLISEGMTVVRALALSGGLNESASEDKITIIRESIDESGQLSVEEIKASLFDQVLPNDVISVGESRF